MSAYHWGLLDAESQLALYRKSEYKKRELEDDIAHIQDVVTNKPYFYKDLSYYIQNSTNNMEFNMNHSNSNEFLNVRKSA